jgi:hypothetical protein
MKLLELVCLIFLGAGASKPYGIPTLQEFSQDALNILKQNGHEELIQNIQETLIEFEMSLDFESLYSILDGLANPLKSVQYAGPFTAFLVKNKSNLPKNYDYSQVLSDLRRIIYDKCSIINDSTVFEKVVKNMDELLEATAKNGTIEWISGLVGRQSTYLSNIFATTNYDMSLELYFFSKGMPIIDGYKEKGGSIEKYFDPFLLSKIYSDRNSRGILKLHGSIWQFLRGNTMIKTKLDPHSKALPFSIHVEKEMMIYPTKEKDLLNHHFFPFFSIFKNIRWFKLLVIGYSFRDEPINMAIIENMMLNKESQIIIIDPNPKEALDNLYSNISENITWRIPRHRLFTFEGKFGSDEVFEYLQKIKSVSYDQDVSFDPSKI